MKSTKTELLDGPTGTELERRGFRLEGPLWSADAVERAPDLLRQIHADYLDAGATIVTANTFRTNRASVVSVGRASFDAGALTRKAVKIAREALKSSSRPQSARIAGSLAPVGDCYTPSDSRSDGFVRDDHRAHLEALIDAECDILLIETMNSLPEAIVAAEEADRLGAPFLLSIVTDRSGRRMLDGTDLSMAVQTLSQFRPEAILANCSSPQAVAEGVRVFRSVKEEGGFAWGYGGYPNSGDPDPIDGWERVREVSSEDFDHEIVSMIEQGATWLGSCCGTTPATTQRIRTLLDRPFDPPGNSGSS